MPDPPLQGGKSSQSEGTPHVPLTAGVVMRPKALEPPTPTPNGPQRDVMVEFRRDAPLAPCSGISPGPRPPPPPPPHTHTLTQPPEGMQKDREIDKLKKQTPGQPDDTRLHNPHARVDTANRTIGPLQREIDAPPAGRRRTTPPPL